MKNEKPNWPEEEKSDELKEEDLQNEADGPHYDEIEEITFKLTDLANELEHYSEYGAAEGILKQIETLCKDNMLDIPDEAEKLRVTVDTRKSK